MGELNFTSPPGNKPTMQIVDTRKRDLWRFYKNGTLVSRVNHLGQRISNAGDQYKYLSVGIGDIAADSDALVYPIMNLPMGATISAVYLAVDTTVAANATNYETIALKDADANTIASITTASVGFTAGTPRTMGTISTTHGILVADEGVYLSFTKAASGMALSGMSVIVIYAVDLTYTNAHSVDETDPPLLAWVDSPDAAEVILSDRDAGDHLDFNNGAFHVTLDGKILTTSVDRHNVVVQCVGDITASGPTPATFAFFKPSKKCKVTKFYIGADTSLALSSDTNYLTAKLIKYTGSASLEICRATIGGPYASGQALTAGTLSKVADEDNDDMVALNQVIDTSDTVWLVLSKTGTGGTDVSSLTVQVVFEKLE